MDFGKALTALKNGLAVTRDEWNGKDMYIYVLQWLSNPITKKADYEPVLTMHTAAGLEQPGWLASQEDLFADDWKIAENARAKIII